MDQEGRIGKTAVGPAALSQDPGRQPQLVLRKSGEEEQQEEGEAEDLEECESNRVPEVGLEEQAQRLVLPSGKQVL